MALTPPERKKLLAEKKRIESFIRVVSTERAERMRRRLQAINTRLNTDPRTELQHVNLDSPLEAQIDGRGTLDFQAQSPPGVGRLVRLPFYLTGFPALTADGPLGLKPTIVTDGGAFQLPVANPTVIAQVHARSLGNFSFATPILEWAKLRIVGFQAQSTVRPSFIPTGFDPIYQTTTPSLLVRSLQVGGGANLFPDEHYMDATVFSPMVPEFAGLRAYPILESPNFATVRAAVQGTPGGVTGVLAPVDTEYYFVTFSLALICEILDDKDFGSHIPGPYARLNAIARDPYPRGTAFLHT